MSRRYLSTIEANIKLKQNKTIEIFLGGFISNLTKCIRWVSITQKEDSIVAEIWEVLDEGSPNYLDVYSFSSLSSEFKPTKIITGNTLEEILDKLNLTDSKLVNQGIIQDEYADYLENC